MRLPRDALFVSLGSLANHWRASASIARILIQVKAYDFTFQSGERSDIRMDGNRIAMMAQ